MAATCVVGCLAALPAGYALLGGSSAGAEGEPRAATTSAAGRPHAGTSSSRPAAGHETPASPATSPASPTPAEPTETPRVNPTESGQEPTEDDEGGRPRETPSAPSPSQSSEPEPEPEPTTSQPPDDGDNSSDWCPFEDPEWRRKYCDE